MNKLFLKFEIFKKIKGYFLKIKKLVSTPRFEIEKNKQNFIHELLPLTKEEIEEEEKEREKEKRGLLGRFYDYLNRYGDRGLLSVVRFFLFFFKDKLRKKDSELRIYGIYGYFGLWGQGKTIAMTKELFDLRQKYGDKILITTNYHFELQDFEFNDWRQLLKKYDKPLVCAWDEVQNEFSSRNFKSFPTQLLTLLTQNRKGNGIRILYSAQRWERVDKVFRELTLLCGECKTRFGRLTGVRFYNWEEYEQLRSTVIVEQKIKIKSVKRKLFVQTDYLRSLYDSFKMLESAKKKEYVGHGERASE